MGDVLGFHCLIDVLTNHRVSAGCTAVHIDDCIRILGKLHLDTVRRVAFAIPNIRDYIEGVLPNIR